jgi:acyl-CoA thioesterase FadM
MARLKIELPQKILTTVTIPVRITDINYGNHLGNNAMVEIVHEARIQFLQQHGFTELSAGGTSLIMNELLVEFKREAFYGDLLEIKIFCGEISKAGFELFYSLSAKREEQKMVTIAYAKTGMVCYNYETKKIEPVPEKLKLMLTP